MKLRYGSSATVKILRPPLPNFPTVDWWVAKKNGPTQELNIVGVR